MHKSNLIYICQRNRWKTIKKMRIKDPLVYYSQDKLVYEIQQICTEQFEPPTSVAVNMFAYLTCELLIDKIVFKNIHKVRMTQAKKLYEKCTLTYTILMPPWSAVNWWYFKCFENKIE